ncbi:MAG TPA: MFS transporter [Gammaproteobacteria bacterium]|nr:MFS transporter [Gammaproteobacteria bacterium]
MRSALAATSTLLFGILVLMLGAGLHVTLLGVRATAEGFSTFATGILLACYYAGMAVGSVAAPRLVRRVGHIRVFAGLTSIASATVLLHSLFVNPWAWGALRSVSGFGFAGVYVVAESWLNHQADNRTRGALLGVYMVVLYTGQGLGQFLLNAADPRGSVLFIVVSVLISTAVVPMTFTAQRMPELASPRRAGLRDLLDASPLGVVGVCASGAASGTAFSLAAVYAATQGFAVSRIAEFVALGIFAAVLIQLPLGRLSDRMDRRNVLAVMSSVAAVAALAAWLLAERSTPLLFFAAATCAGLSFSTYSIAAAHVNDHLTPAQMVAASGTLLLVNAGGAVAAPIVVSAAMQWTTNEAYFAALAAMHLAFAGYTLWRKRRRAPVPAAEKAPFVAQPRTPQMAPLAADLAAAAGGSNAGASGLDGGPR